MRTLKFRTQSQVVLFKHELLGQLSDGHWENLNVRNHYQSWHECNVEVGSPVGRDFLVSYDKYNFCAKDLLEAVGKRMIAYVRLSIVFGIEGMETLKELLDLYGNYSGIPTHSGQYWNDLRNKIQTWLTQHNVSLEQVVLALADERYGKKELLTDLREMKMAIKVIL